MNATTTAQASATRTRLRNVLIALFAIGVPLAWMRDPQLVWQPLLPIPLLFLTPRGTTRVLAFFAAVLVVLGGGVTTYREGMAVPDWPATFDQNMWTYPYAEMLNEGKGVTLEHVHRLWASALGLVAICVLLSCFIYRARTTVTVFASLVLLAIIGQGLLGGTRVLENSQNLAFLHGAIAQAVVASIVALAVFCSRTWQRAERVGSEYARGAHFLGPWVAGSVYTQIALGAWLRHQGQTIALLIHITLALFVVVAVLVLAKQLGVAAKEAPAAASASVRPLARLQSWLLGSLIAQFLLGVLATYGIYSLSGGMQAQVSLGEAVFATAHVFVGAVLLSSTVVGTMYARRVLRPPVVASAGVSAGVSSGAPSPAHHAPLHSGS
ncbi:Heme A synthase [Planctomycetes bacterium Poly30]|uniref:Heme A synthase n=1 Tax=Saltatorellus ferox TaxID=2528018 RepID=A0A518EQ93_9BACT|nr:Heme A synthase [Planctomycetes bacterium Poly30]